MEMFGDGSAFNLEHRSLEDDAWYTVRVVLVEGKGEQETTLVVKFQGFTEFSDVKYTVGQFQSVAEVEQLAARFRQLSKQVQDRECQQVTKGMKVCAALSCRDDDLRYFDAVVDAVNKQTHVFTNGEEECKCRFILVWLHGPNLGNLTEVGIGNICSLQTGALVDPDIAIFSTLAKQQILIASSHCRMAFEPHTSALRGSTRWEASCLSSNAKSSSQMKLQENRAANDDNLQWQIQVLSSSGRACRHGEQSDSDEDLGGNDVVQTDGLHFILIDNLETYLLPSIIKQFIHEHTFISPEAYVFPSRPSATYASGAIVLDSITKLEKIFKFLNNPEHFIVSARGRPWIITGKMFRRRAFGSAASILALEYQDDFQKGNIDRELQVVQLGTEAYKKAKQLRELFMEFVNHEDRICKRLAFEETRILQSSG